MTAKSSKPLPYIGILTIFVMVLTKLIGLDLTEQEISALIAAGLILASGGLIKEQIDAIRARWLK
jgi:hypothetical protein